MPRSDRNERVERLRRKAQERSVQTFARSRRAIMALQARNEAVTIKSVALEASVSESYLTKNSELKAEIDNLRSQRAISRPPRSTTDPRTVATLRTQLDVAVDQLKKLTAENSRLRDENANLRGAVLEARRSRRP